MARSSVKVLTDNELASEIAHLVAESEREGFRFLRRFTDERAKPKSLAAPASETWLGVRRDGELVAFGGLTPDPYLDAPRTGRLRHLYVLPSERRKGFGRTLVDALETAAVGEYDVLRLRTDTSDAARFYEHLGYEALASDDSATHQRRLAAPRRAIADSI
jgi:GNAT superfamily N-acetyltransferase